MSEKIFVRPAQETSEGDSVEVKRLFPIPSYMNFDPFVLWDHFDVQPGSGFPDHPHRGFEAITYMFSGTMQHTDNLGNQSRVGSGGAQRFTAGKGIVHSEMPGSDGSNSGIQLWINLPKRLKQLDPDYQEVQADAIPEMPIEGGSVRTIVGEGSPIKLHTPVRYEEIRLQPGAELTQSIEPDMRGLIYVVEGEVSINDQKASTAEAVFIDNTDTLTISAVADSWIMLCLGKPHREPIRQWGPYVD